MSDYKSRMANAMLGSTAIAVTDQSISPWFNTKEAAIHLGCTEGTLKSWRSRGQGPRYYTLSQRLVRYHASDLDAFVTGEASS